MHKLSDIFARRGMSPRLPLWYCQALPLPVENSEKTSPP